LTTGFGAAEPAGVVEEVGGFTAGAGEGFGADVPDTGALTIGFGVTPEVEGVTEAGFGAGVLGAGFAVGAATLGAAGAGTGGAVVAMLFANDDDVKCDCVKDDS
jgi:voltage-gated potassium channel Kch